jgi:adenylate cyclase
MRQFFSPAVVETLVENRGSAKLEPREGPVSVLFCDVRGFSKKVEESSDDLRTVLARVREALSVMTRAILKYEGVIADFQGDAALAFWGWPTTNDEAATLACRTALAIHSAFAAAQRDPKHILYGYRVGVGIAYGDAIAGRIGSEEQIKVGVFGPVVNLASRLQDLTKAVGVPILIDGPTAAAIADALPDGEVACRRVARVRPRGLEAPVEMFAIMPAEGEWERLSASELEAYDRAAQALEAGLWVEAGRLLEKLPPHDGPSNFLRLALSDMGETPPSDWTGALPVDRRGILAAAGAEG